MKKKTVYILVSVIAAVFLAVFGAGWYMLDYALTPAADNRDMPKRYAAMYRDYPYMRPWVDSLRRVGALRDTFVTMADGLHHHAVYVRNSQSAGRTAVLVHGYKDSHVGMMPIAKIYADMDYNILLPDLHAHGLSEGDEIQMGWKDRVDVLRWIALADTLFADSVGRPRIAVHGVSMGAATVMCVAGEDYPENVRCFIDDCGYTSAWDEFSCQLADQFGLPDFPLLYAASAVCKLRYGWTFGEASPIRQLSRKEVPMMYIHGSSDYYVPSQMVFSLYNANPVSLSPDGKTRRYNDIWIAAGSAHATSFRDHPQEYARRVGAFVKMYVGSAVSR